MLGLPASTVYAASNALYIIVVAAAAICTFVIYQSSAIVLKEEKAEFETYKIQAGKDVAAAYAEGVKAGSEAAEAKAVAAKANARAAEADARAAEANAKAQEASAQAESSRLEIARLTTPRRITDEQKALLVSYLKDAPRSQIVLNLQFLSEGEINLYLESVGNFLVNNGYSLPKEGGINHLMSYKEAGLKFASHDDEASQKLASSLHDAFTKAGIDSRLTSDKNLTPGQIYIYVGRRF